MKKPLWLAIILLIICVLAFSACDGSKQNQNNSHVHSFGEWTTVYGATCTNKGAQERICSCGEKETQSIAAMGHTEEIIPAVPATCTAAGTTEGKKCSVCNALLALPKIVQPTAHTEEIIPAVPATCTAAGTTEGKKCSVCNTLLALPKIVQPTAHTEEIIPAVPATCTAAGTTEGKKCSVCGITLEKPEVICASGHKYNEGETLGNASCIQEGIMKYSCTNPSCKYSYIESYSLPQYSATEIYNQAIQYAGEIILYDKQGKKIATGTGFVLSSDGRIITNYHVIENAYSATISINGKTYSIKSVLSYNATIDLAVLQIDANNLTAAKICKNAVQAGETVYSIGSSRGMTNTFSHGIITYANRVVDGISHVQHDAPISSGNSGGPLINIYGEVIGINTWCIADSENAPAQNLNFAVFTRELDKLIYGEPMTLAKFYETFFQ